MKIYEKNNNEKTLIDLVKLLNEQLNEQKKELNNYRKELNIKNKQIDELIKKQITTNITQTYNY